MIFYIKEQKLHTIHSVISKSSIHDINILKDFGAWLVDMETGKVKGFSTQIISVIVNQDTRTVHILSTKDISILTRQEYICLGDTHVYDELFNNGYLELNIHENISNFRDLRKIFRWLFDNNYYIKNNSSEKVHFNIDMSKAGWDFNYHLTNIKDITTYFIALKKIGKLTTPELGEYIDEVYFMLDIDVSEHEIKSHIKSTIRNSSLDALII